MGIPPNKRLNRVREVVYEWMRAGGERAACAAELIPIIDPAEARRQQNEARDREIYRLRKEGVPVKALVERFGVSSTTIREAIWSGQYNDEKEQNALVLRLRQEGKSDAGIAAALGLALDAARDVITRAVEDDALTRRLFPGLMAGDA